MHSRLVRRFLLIAGLLGFTLVVGTVGFKLIDLYEKANDELTPKMEEVLAVRWKVAGNAKLAHAGKAAAIRNSMAASARAAKISHEERVKQLQLLLLVKPRQM